MVFWPINNAIIEVDAKPIPCKRFGCILRAHRSRKLSFLKLHVSVPADGYDTISEETKVARTRSQIIKFKRKLEQKKLITRQMSLINKLFDPIAFVPMVVDLLLDNFFSPIMKPMI